MLEQEGRKVVAIIIIIVLIFIIISLVAFSVMQIQLAGIEVKDFWTFVKATENLDRLYVFSKKYNRMSPQEKVIFLAETEKMSSAFEKIPEMIWEEEYPKCGDIMDIYRAIKVARWKENSKK